MANNNKSSNPKMPFTDEIDSWNKYFSSVTPTGHAAAASSSTDVYNWGNIADLGLNIQTPIRAPPKLSAIQRYRERLQYGQPAPLRKKKFLPRNHKSKKLNNCKACKKLRGKCERIRQVAKRLKRQKLKLKHRTEFLAKQCRFFGSDRDKPTK